MDVPVTLASTAAAAPAHGVLAVPARGVVLAAPASLVFTATNWNIAQTVTVTGVFLLCVAAFAAWAGAFHPTLAGGLTGDDDKDGITNLVEAVKLTKSTDTKSVIDALETMNIPPAKLLVLPRLAAVLVMMPAPRWTTS